MNHRINSKVDYTKYLRMKAVTEQVQRDIVAGHIRNGSRVDSRSICEQFQIHQSTSECVLNDLTGMKFIEKVKNSKAFVVCYNHSEAAALGAARQKWEGKALRAAVANISEAGTGACRKRFADFENAPSPSQKIFANQKFFSNLYYGTEFTYGRTGLERNFDAYGKYLLLIWSELDHLANYRQDMSDFLDLCDRNDVAGAASLMLGHITTVSRAIANGLMLRESIAAETTVYREGVSPS